MDLRFIIIVMILFGAGKVAGIAQDSIRARKFTLTGYISSLQNATFDSIQGKWFSQNTIHNRLNFKWFPTDHFAGALELRNRFVFGENLSSNIKNYETDYGLVKLTANVFHGNSYLLNTSVDRLWFAYEKNKWKITLGRQRINWSQTWAWNPNDIFNAYSFFDFDYAERPGSDALRVQYYNSEVSVTELAMKMNNQRKVTAAGYYKFNKWNYDFQVLGGVLNQTDYVIGTGWSGAINRVAFRGEMSYFRSSDHLADSTGLFLGSIAFDYTFSNSLMLMTEFFYSSQVSGIQGFQAYYNAPLTVKNLSFVKYNLLLQATYPITPLLSGTLAGIYLPQVKGYYIGPSLSYSASDNLEVSIFVQSFRAKIKDAIGEEQRLRYNLVFLRGKFSF